MKFLFLSLVSFRFAVTENVFWISRFMFDGFIVDVIILTSLVKISCLAFRNASENWRFYRYVCAVLACREKKQKGKKRKERNGRAVSTSRVSLEKKKLEIHKRSFIDFASYDNIVDSRVIFTIFGWNAWSFDFLPLGSPQRDHSLSLSFCCTEEQ